LLNVVDNDLRPGASEKQRMGPAEACPGASDNGGATFKRNGHDSPQTALEKPLAVFMPGDKAMDGSAAAYSGRVWGYL
jgi:hypothetical protein